MERDATVWAYRDELTGLGNRGALYHLGPAGEPGLTMAMIDVDDLKSFNHTFGHVAGDAALCELGTVEALRIPHGAPGHPHVTVSIGVALTHPDTTLSATWETAARRAYWLKEHHRRGQVRADDADPGPGPVQP